MPFAQMAAALGTTLGGKLVGKGLEAAGVGPEMANATGESVAPMMKIAGIPTPGTGAMLGQDAKAYMDKAFPGTNPWERLGASYPGASVDAAQTNVKGQKEMQEKELKTRKDIARIQADATTQAASIAHGPAAVSAVDRFRNNGDIGEFDTPTTIAVRKVESEIAKLEAETRALLAGEVKTLYDAIVSQNEAKMKQALAQYDKKIAELEVTNRLTQNNRGTVYNLGKYLKDYVNDSINKYKFWSRGKTAPIPLQRSAPGKVRGSTHYKNQ